MATQPPSKSFQRSMNEWILWEFIRIVSTKHGNPVPIDNDMISQMSDSELAAMVDRMEVIARIPPK